MNIGIFGGTFDPPHLGHLKLALEGCKLISLHKIHFVPAYIPPHKSQSKTSDSHLYHVVEMLEILLKDYPNFSVDLCEIKRKGISYTIDTLNKFSEQFRQDKLFILIGEDQFIEFHLWKDFQKILDLAKIVVFSRNPEGSSVNLNLNPFIPSELTNRFIFIPFTNSISSSLIRNKIRADKGIQGLVPPEIEDYIKTYRVYP